jgi:hypothetical protein
MTIKSSVIDFCKAIEKERLKERSVYLLDRIIAITNHKVAKIRIAYNRYERKKVTRYGRREDHFLYTDYIKTSKVCMELKKALLTAYELLYQNKEDILRTDEFGQLHAERYVEFISTAKILNVIMEKIDETFGGWFISYSLRMKRIYKRFNYHLNVLSQLLVNDGREVYWAYRMPDENVDYVNKNENTNFKKTMKSRMKSMRYSSESSPGAIPVTRATRKTDQDYAPMALYYENSPLQGSVVFKNKEYLERILSHFLEFTSHFDDLGKRLKTAKNTYSRTSIKSFSRRNRTFTGSPSSIREKTIQAVLLRMGEFKKLIQERQTDLKEMDIDEKTFVQQLEVIEKGQPKRGYLELKRIVEHLVNETNPANRGYEITMDMKARLIEHSDVLDRALKKDLETEYVDKHFPKMTFHKS